MLGGTFMPGKFTAAATPPAKIIYIKGSGRDSEASQQIDLEGTNKEQFLKVKR